MDWYLMVLRRYADFDGRSRRTEFWMFTLFNFIILLVLCVVGAIGVVLIEKGDGMGGLLFVPACIYVLVTVVPGLAVSVRRLHDSGKSGWLLLLLWVIGIIPIIGLVASVAQIVLMCLDSDPGTNLYGPNPKFPAMAAGVFAANAGFAPMAFGEQSRPFTAVSNVRVCGKCGARSPGESTFCGFCGAQV